MPAVARPRRALVAALVTAMAAGAIWLRAFPDAYPIPVSDESAHLKLLSSLAMHLRGAAGVEWLHRLVFSPESYPQLPYLLGLPFLESAHDPNGVRYAFLAPTIATAALVAWMATERVGAPLAVALGVALVGCPIVLAYSHLYVLDYPQYLLVALTLAGLDWSGAFTRPDRLWVIAVGMIGCLLSKWTAAAFLAPPLVLAGAIAVGAGPGSWGRRLATGAVTVLVLGALALAVWRLGEWPQVSLARAGGRWQVVPLVAVALGLAMLPAPPLVRRLREGLTRTPLLGVIWVSVAVVLVCGPWYVLAHDTLIARREHELHMLAIAGDTRQFQGRVLWQHLQAAVPWAPVGMALALVAALVRPRGLPATLACFSGGLGAAWYLNQFIPFDPRYYIPTTALLLAGYASALRHHSDWVRTGGAVVLVASLTPSTWRPLAAPTSPDHPAMIEPGYAGLNFRLVQGSITRAEYRRVPVGAFTSATTARLMDAVAAACEHPGCTVAVDVSGPIDIEARSIEALGRLRGLDIRGIERQSLTAPGARPPEIWVRGACEGSSGEIQLGGIGCSVGVAGRAGLEP